MKFRYNKSAEKLEFLALVVPVEIYTPKYFMMAMIIILVQVKKLFLGSDLPWEYLSFDIIFYPPTSLWM
jgi:hypothetical protein